MIAVCPGDIARSARTRAAALRGFAERINHPCILAHAKIVVRAPDSDFGSGFPIMMFGAGEFARHALQLRKVAVIALTFELFECVTKNRVVIHQIFPETDRLLWRTPFSIRPEHCPEVFNRNAVRRYSSGTPPGNSAYPKLPSLNGTAVSITFFRLLLC